MGRLSFGLCEHSQGIIEPIHHFNLGAERIEPKPCSATDFKDAPCINLLNKFDQGIGTLRQRRRCIALVVFRGDGIVIEVGGGES